MGYNTIFSGELKFQNEITVPQLAKLHTFFGEDCRDHPEWQSGEASYIDLVLNKEYTGIQWDDSTEKTYGLVDCVNLIIREMREEFPDFSLCGVLTAQGEMIEDRWQLYIHEDGFARKRDVVIAGAKIKCPHCKHEFYAE